MKKLIRKIKEQPLEKKLLFGGMLLWLYPFIESIVIGATGMYDLSILALVLLGIGGLPLLYFLYNYIRQVIYWISLLFKKKK